MLRHIVLVGFKPDATAGQREAVQQAIAAMPAAEPEILALSCGENVGAGPSHFDLAVVMDFADIDAFRRYIGGAVHRAYVEGPRQGCGRPPRSGATSLLTEEGVSASRQIAAASSQFGRAPRRGRAAGHGRGASLQCGFGEGHPTGRSQYV